MVSIIQKVTLDKMSTEIIQDFKQLINNFDELKSDHDSILTDLLENRDDLEKLKIIQRNIDQIELAKEEAQIIIDLKAHLNNMESEKPKLIKENCWLRDELGYIQQRLQSSEQMVAQLEEEKKHFEFMASLKQYEEPNTSKEFDPVVDLFPSSEDLLLTSSRYCNKIPSKLQTLINLVIQYSAQKKYEVAIPLCQKALEELAKIGDFDQPEVATMLSVLAIYYKEQFRYKESMELLKAAVEIREKTLGIDHPAYVAGLNNLAVLYGKCSDYKNAEILSKKVLKIREKLFGKTHSDVGKQLSNIALICKHLEKFEESIIYNRRALIIFEKNLGANNPNTIRVKNSLASCYLKLKKFKRAEMLYREVLIKVHEYETQIIKSMDGKNGTAYNQQGYWHKINSDLPSFKMTLKKLVCLFKIQGNIAGVEIMQGCSVFGKTHAILEYIKM